MINLKSASLLDILPPSLSSDPAMTAAATALDAQLQETTVLISILDILGRSAEWSDTEADELAWQYNTPYYDPDLFLEQRRRLVKNSIPLHRHKGTPGALENVLSIIFKNAQVVEWFEYGGAPGHFKVSIQEIINLDVYSKAIAAINSVKNVRSVLDTIETVFEYSRGLEISNGYSTLSYPYQAFASQTLYAGVPYNGPAVVNVPTAPVYNSGTIEETSTFTRTLQASYPITGLIYVGSSGVIIPPMIRPDDQAANYSSGEEFSSSYQTKLQETYKLVGTIYSGGELIK